ncbi:hypothetical protein P7H12_10595 [Paenibacillus larvae]|nr:hypothetical protein [Paenibacillus larvae]MDT2263952.1 hypothetical protein [Paenibacillus larvae]
MFVQRRPVNDQRRNPNANEKTKALALTWTKTFFKGDVAQDPKSFDGLQKRLTGKQVIDGKSGELYL